MEPLTTAVTGLLGVLVGAWITIASDRAKAKRDFVSRQLSEFYALMVGIREEIRMLSEFRQKVAAYAGDLWKELCEIGRASENPEALQKLLEPERDKIDTRIEYDNTQLQEKLIPAYRRMVDLFREKYWLADFETRQYFTPLVEFVEGWNRFLTRTHSAEVLRRVDVKEDKLLPFYEHLEKTHDSLRNRAACGLKNGHSCRWRKTRI